METESKSNGNHFQIKWILFPINWKWYPIEMELRPFNGNQYFQNGTQRNLVHISPI